MKEIKDILRAYDQAKKDGRRCALATVVHVEGSSYRRPGARMLVTDTGQLTGAISGGCLEGDALRKALLAIHEHQNKLVSYDSTEDDDLNFGIQLGCNGIVDILFEPIDDTQPSNPIQLLRQIIHAGENAILVTLFSTTRIDTHPGTSLVYTPDGAHLHISSSLSADIISDAKTALEQASSNIKTFGTMNAFIEYIPQPPAIVIAGAGNDVIPLVDCCAQLGWHITVVDGRPTHATHARFPNADRVMIAKPDQVIGKTCANDRTIFLLMTHNYNYDLALLKELIMIDHFYIGLLGPRKKLERMLNDGLELDDRQLSSIHSPVGLDIGAETAQEIALSIVAEIKAVLAGRTGMALKDRSGSIHNRPSSLYHA